MYCSLTASNGSTTMINCLRIRRVGVGLVVEREDPERGWVQCGYVERVKAALFDQGPPSRLKFSGLDKEAAAIVQGIPPATIQARRKEAPQPKDMTVTTNFGERVFVFSGPGGKGSDWLRERWSEKLHVDKSYDYGVTSDDANFRTYNGSDYRGSAKTYEEACKSFSDRLAECSIVFGMDEAFKSAAAAMKEQIQEGIIKPILEEVTRKRHGPYQNVNGKWRRR
jgi:hypothetical protein